MKRRQLTEEEFFDLIGAVELSALRWEHQAIYVDEPGEAEAVEAWAAGDRTVPEFDHPWVEMVQALTDRGGCLMRVRVQEDPPNTYQQWLAWLADVWNVPVGEQIRVVSRPALPWPMRVLARRRRDWWLLDGRRLIVLSFDRAGRRVATELVDSPLAARWARAWWDLAVRYSTPAPRQGVLTST